MPEESVRIRTVRIFVSTPKAPENAQDQESVPGERRDRTEIRPHSVELVVPIAGQFVSAEHRVASSRIENNPGNLAGIHCKTLAPDPWMFADDSLRATLQLGPEIVTKSHVLKTPFPSAGQETQTALHAVRQFVQPTVANNEKAQQDCAEDTAANGKAVPAPTQEHQDERRQRLRGLRRRRAEISEPPDRRRRRRRFRR